MLIFLVQMNKNKDIMNISLMTAYNNSMTEYSTQNEIGLLDCHGCDHQDDDDHHSSSKSSKSKSKSSKSGKRSKSSKSRKGSKKGPCKGTYSPTRTWYVLLQRIFLCNFKEIKVLMLICLHEITGTRQEHGIQQKRVHQ